MDSTKTVAKPMNRPSVRHSSHNHPLRVFKSQDEDEIICSGCECDLIGQAFKCTKSECEYFLHKSCFDLPSKINHKSHTDHPLTLLHSPPIGLSTYTCNACGEYGSAFTYNCSECQYNVHVGCVFVPENVKHEDHEHQLTLLYNTPCKGREDNAMFICDVCKEDMSENLWVYYCKECDYGTHVHSCATYEDDELKRREEASSSSDSTIKSVMEAEKKLKEMALIHQLQLDAIDRAGNYVDSWETKKIYYW